MFEIIPFEILLLIFSSIDDFRYMFVCKTLLDVCNYLLDKKDPDFRFLKIKELCFRKHFKKHKHITIGFRSYNGYKFIQSLLRQNFAFASISNLVGPSCVLINRKKFIPSKANVVYPYHRYYYQFHVGEKMKESDKLPVILYNEDVLNITKCNDDMVDYLQKYSDFGETRVSLLKSISEKFISKFLLKKIFRKSSYKLASQIFRNVFFKGTTIRSDEEESYRQYFYDNCTVKIGDVLEHLKKEVESLALFLMLVCNKNDMRNFLKTKNKDTNFYTCSKQEIEDHFSFDDLFWFISAMSNGECDRLRYGDEFFRLFFEG